MPSLERADNRKVRTPRLGRMLAAGVAAVALSLGSLVVVSPAVAAGPAILAATITTSSPTVVSGDFATWSIDWSCTDSVTGTCVNAVLRVPIPAPVPFLAGAALAPCSVTGSTGGHTTLADVDSGVAVWTFTPTVPTGSSGTMQLQCTTRPFETANGQTFTPEGTFTATNANTVVVPGPTVTVTSEILNTGFLRGNTIPTLDAVVAYNFYTSAYIFTPANGVSGRGILNADSTNMTLTVPTTAVIVDARGDGTVQPVIVPGPGGFGGTVTVTATGANANQDNMFVYLRWPSLDSLNNVLNNVGDVRTLTATTSTNHPLAPPFVTTYTLDGPNQIVIQPTPTGVSSIIVSKAELRGFPNVQRGSLASWYLDIANTNAFEIEYSITDHLPCAVTSPWSGGCPAGNLGVHATQVQLLSSDPLFYPQNVSVFTNLGNTFTTTPLTTLTTQRAFRPTLAVGEFFTEVTVSGRLLSFERARPIIEGIVPSTFPTVVPPSTTYRVTANNTPAAGSVPIENCIDIAGGDFTANRFGGPSLTTAATDGGAGNCSTINVIPPAPKWQILALPNGTIVGPGDAVTFTTTMMRTEAALPSSPVFTSLLPAGMDFVPTSFRIVDTPFNTVFGFPQTPQSAQVGWGVIPTVITNYAGTGRTLVRATWPALVLPQNGVLTVEFRAQVGLGAVPGGNTIESSVFDAVRTTTTDLCTTAARQTPDVFDLNGNGNATELRCESSAIFTVAAGGAVNVASLVRGSSDPVFVGTPAVGRTVPGSTAFFSVDVQSAGNVAIRNVVSYMILPRVGDTFVSGALAASPRGSAWRPTVVNVVVPAGSIVQYSQSTNPCRGEVFSTGGSTASAPAGCVNDWSAGPPSPLSNVAALRFVTAGPVDPGVTNRFVVEVSTPPTAVGIAYNSIATAAQRADTSAFLQPAETARVGIEAAPVFVTKTVVSGPVDNFDGSQSVQYRIEVRNDGTTPATYALSDDPGFAVASSVVSRSAVNSPPGTIATLPGFDSQATNVIVTGQPIAAGDTHTYLVEMTVRVPVAATSAAADCTLGALEPGTGLLNRASVTVGTAVGVSEACVVPLSGQLQITKTVDAPLANLGDRLTYTVTVANFGSMRAVNLVATDTMPAGLVYVSDTGSGIVSGQVVTWDIPVLQAGQSVSFTLVADIAATFAGTVLDNTVGVAQPLGFAALAVVGPSASNSSLALARTTLRTLGLPGSAALGFTGADVGGGLLAGGVLLGFGALLVAMRRKSVVGSS